MMSASIGSSATSNYHSSMEIFLSWYKKTNLHKIYGWHEGVVAVAYLTHLFMENKGISTALQFSAGHGISRIKMGLPRLTDIPRWKTVLKQIFKAFRKQARVAEIPLPSLSTMLAVLNVPTISAFDICMNWLFWTSSMLALRTMEIFLLKKDYITPDPQVQGGFVITWPKKLMGNGIKAGQIRHIHPTQANMVRLFMLCDRNPFLPWAKNSAKEVNEYLDKKYKCTMRAARHIGAYAVLHETNSVSYVASSLGHSSEICACYYLDPWCPTVSWNTITDRIIQLVRKRFFKPKRT